MMLQIRHRESHDIDIFIDDGQIIGFLDPSKADLAFDELPSEYAGDGARFQRFAFHDVGEVDFIFSSSLTARPFVPSEIDGRSVKLETVAEIVAKKVFHRGSEAKPRDIFDIAAAAQVHRDEVIAALGQFPDQVSATVARLDKLDADFVSHTISQLMILPDYRPIALSSMSIARDLLVAALHR